MPNKVCEYRIEVIEMMYKANQLRSLPFFLPCLMLMASIPFIAGMAGEPVARGHFLMCKPGTHVFSETFTQGSVSDRWGIRAHYEIEGGMLKRTRHEPEATARTFLKGAAFHNVIIRFDFRFDGASEIRLMTGGGGGYNTVTQISPRHFQVNTAKRNNEFSPSMQGECAFHFKEGKWYTMTVEFHGDEVLAHVDKDHFVVGRHPIINTERTYLAFQVSGTGASFDNFTVWESLLRENWRKKSGELIAAQNARPPAMNRDARERYDLIMLNLKDKLSRNDSKYRELVTRHAKLQAELKADYPEAFRTHKELSKGIAKKRLQFRAKNPRFKEMESAVNKARKKVKEYLHSRHAELEQLPKHLYYAAFEQHRRAMAGDSRLKELEENIASLEVSLQKAFPEAFRNVEELVAQRKAYAASLKNNEDFSTRRKAIALANDAINDYLLSREPALKQLAPARMAIIRNKNQDENKR